MTETKLDRGVIFALRILTGWTFLYAGTWQILQNYSAAGFLNHVVTFHDFFARFATPAVLPYTDFLMKWGHLLIGLSTGFRPARSGKRPFRHSAHDYLLLCPHGMAIYREPFQSFCRLPPGLRGRDRLPDGASCWSRLGLDGVAEQLPVVAHNRLLKSLFAVGTA